MRVALYKHIAWIYFLAVCYGDAQNTAPRDLSPSQQDQSQSFYVGRPVNHPEELSGIWEAPDGHGGAIGLHLLLSTTAPTDITTLVGTRQSWLDLQVGIYERSGAVLQVGEENYFSDSVRGGGVQYDKDRLTLHARGFDLDLRRIRGNEWSGRFHRKAFDSEVTLIRPGSGEKEKNAWFIGTWREGRSGHGQTCPDVAQTAPGQLTGWSDYFQAWGAVRFAPNVPRPPYSLQRYGVLAKVNSSQEYVVSVELNAYAGICCSQQFAAMSAKNGTEMVSRSNERPPLRTAWIKMPGESCIASAD